MPRCQDRTFIKGAFKCASTYVWSHIVSGWDVFDVQETRGVLPFWFSVVAFVVLSCEPHVVPLAPSSGEGVGGIPEIKETF